MIIPIPRSRYNGILIRLLNIFKEKVNQSTNVAIKAGLHSKAVEVMIIPIPRSRYYRILIILFIFLIGNGPIKDGSKPPECVTEA